MEAGRSAQYLPTLKLSGLSGFHYQLLSLTNLQAASTLEQTGTLAYSVRVTAVMVAVNFAKVPM